MKTVWKFPLDVTDRQVVEMPSGARPLCVQVQAVRRARPLGRTGIAVNVEERPFIWALVDDAAPRRKRVVLTHGTGHHVAPLAAAGVYVGSFQLDAGALVFHVFMAAEEFDA